MYDEVAEQFDNDVSMTALIVNEELTLINEKPVWYLDLHWYPHTWLRATFAHSLMKSAAPIELLPVTVHWLK